MHNNVLKRILMLFSVAIMLSICEPHAYAEGNIIITPNENVNVHFNENVNVHFIDGAESGEGVYSALSNTSVSFSVSLTSEAQQQNYKITGVKVTGGNNTELSVTSGIAAGEYSFTMPEEGNASITVDTAICYDIWVGGTRITGDNKNNVIQTAPGTVSYIPENNTLYLNNATITCSEGYGIKIDEGTSITIVFSGTNNIFQNLNNGLNYSYGIASSVNTILEASSAVSKMMIEADNAGVRSAGIFIDNGSNLFISANSTVQSYGGSAPSSYGAYINGNVSVLGELFAQGGAAATDSVGLFCKNLNVQARNNAIGEVTAEAFDSVPGAVNSTGIKCEGNITTEYGTGIIALGGTATSESCGINCTILSNGGGIAASANKGNNKSCGINAGAINDSGTRLSADSMGSNSGSSYGISAGSINANGNLVEASAASAAVESIGIKGAVNISNNCVVESYGVSSAFSSEPTYNNYYPVIYGCATEGQMTKMPEAIDCSQYRKLHIESGLAPEDENDSDSGNNSDTEQTETYSSVISDIVFACDNPVRVSKGALKTLYYIVTPYSGADKTAIDWTYTESSDGIISIESDKNSQSLSIATFGNGTVYLTGKTTDGGNVEKTLTIIIGEPEKYLFTYIQNDGIWCYDSPSNFTLSCSGPASDFAYALIDGMKVYSGSGTYMTSGMDETVITFCPTYMESLSHQRHTVSLVYSNGNSNTINIYVQSRFDPPKTGDSNNLKPFYVLFILSGFILFTMNKKRIHYGI